MPNLIIFQFILCHTISFCPSVHAARLRKESIKLDAEEDKTNRPKKAFEIQRKKTILNCQNTIFGFTKLLWLINEKKTFQNIMRDKDGKAMIEKYLSVSSLLLQYHFEFICFVDSLSKAKVSKKKSF